MSQGKEPFVPSTHGKSLQKLYVNLDLHQGYSWYKSMLTHAGRSGLGEELDLAYITAKRAHFQDDLPTPFHLHPILPTQPYSTTMIWKITAFSLTSAMQTFSWHRIVCPQLTEFLQVQEGAYVCKVPLDLLPSLLHMIYTHFSATYCMPCWWAFNSFPSMCI